jgi:hypothetical protein
MNYRKCFAVILFVLAGSVFAFAQDSGCKAKLAELPPITELSGFHLGMTLEQVKVRVPQVKFGRKNEFGVSKTSINPDFDPNIDKTNFADVRTVSLDFLDGSLTSIWIGFESSFRWKSADEFIKGISRELSLPDEWTTKGRTQQLTCADFQLSVSMIAGGPSLRIVDRSADDAIAHRRQEQEDAAETTAAAAEPTPVVGDVRKKAFYSADCPALKLVPEKSRVAFDNAAEAEKAGYKRSEVCE